jgi:hypothetical protein
VRGRGRGEGRGARGEGQGARDQGRAREEQGVRKGRRRGMRRPVKVGTRGDTLDKKMVEHLHHPRGNLLA